MILRRRMGLRVEKGLLRNPLSPTPYDVRHATWKENQEKQGRRVPRPGQFENRSPLTDWDKGRKKREIAVKKKIRKLKRKSYQTKAKRVVYTRIKSGSIGEGANRMLLKTVYRISDLGRMSKGVDMVHFTGTLSQTHYHLVLALRRRGDFKFFTIAPWACRRLAALKWFQCLPAGLKKMLGVYCKRVKKFWNEKMLIFVEGLVRIKKPYNEISAMLFHLYHHRIKTFSLVKMAIREGWISPPRSRPRRPPKNY